MAEKGPDNQLGWKILSGVTLLRVLVGFQPHSGQDNHHGSIVAYGGDFEAQRHWCKLSGWFSRLLDSEFLSHPLLCSRNHLPASHW